MVLEKRRLWDHEVSQSVRPEVQSHELKLNLVGWTFNLFKLKSNKLELMLSVVAGVDIRIALQGRRAQSSNSSRPETQGSRQHGESDNDNIRERMAPN